MPRVKTPSFICEFEVKSTSKDRCVLRLRKEVGRQIYNAVEGEALRRLAAMRRDPGFELAKAMPHGSTKEDATPEQKAKAKAKQEAFSVLRVKHGFTEAALHQHRSLAKDCWLRDHLDVHTQQKIASRAFATAERWSFAKSGKPRFKRYGELDPWRGSPTPLASGSGPSRAAGSSGTGLSPTWFCP